MDATEPVGGIRSAAVSADVRRVIRACDLLLDDLREFFGQFR